MIRCSELLAGVVDKASIGSTSMGLVHSVYELHGSRQAGLLLNAFARLFTYYLRDAGHTCGLEDLVLTQAADADRVRLLKEVESAAGRGLQEFIAEQGLSTGETGGNKNLEGLAMHTNSTSATKEECEAALRDFKAALSS